MGEYGRPVLIALILVAALSIPLLVLFLLPVSLATPPPHRGSRCPERAQTITTPIPRRLASRSPPF